MTVAIHHGDCSEVIRTLADNSIDSCATDPPYALVSITKRFGKTLYSWDGASTQSALPGAPNIMKGSSFPLERSGVGFASHAATIEGVNHV